MPESAPSNPSTVRQIWVILALATRQKLNQLSRGRGRGRQGLRAATASKGKTSILLPVFLGLLFVGMSFNFGYQAVHGLAHHAKTLHPAEVEEEFFVIRVGVMVYFKLESLTRGQPISDLEREERQFVESIMEDQSLDLAEARKERERYLAHLEKFGIRGFTYHRPSAYQYADLATLSPKARAWYGRALGFLVVCLFLALTLMPLSGRSKDLGAVDSHLAWLYCLPVSGHGILSGQLVAMVLVRPLTWILAWPLFTLLFWTTGTGWLSPVLSLGASLALSLAAGGIELAVETWLRSSASFKLKKNVQSAASIFGVLSFYICLAAGLAAARSSSWLEWTLDHTPTYLTAIPGQLIMLCATGPAGMLQFAGVLALFAGVCGLGGWLLAAKALTHGFSSGAEREGKRSAEAKATGNRSLTKFEWLLLLRDRNLATLVLIVPLLLVFYQALVSPDMLEVTSMQKLALIGFGCGAWAATMTAPHVPMSEGNSLWMIFSLPVELGAYFERRARVWRMTGVIMAAAVITGLALWKGIPGGDWWRVPAALAAVWVVSLAIYAIMIGETKVPEPGRAERPKISVLRMYGCMIMAAIVGGVLWHGDPGQVLSSLVLWWFFGFGLWQGVVIKLRHVLEPTEEVPRQLTVASALLAVIIFFLVQMVAVGAGILASYLIAGVVALVFCGIRLSHLPPALPEEGKRLSFRLTVALPATVLACVAIGALWLTVIRTVPALRELHESAQAEAAAFFHMEKWALVVLVVVAAPVIEEMLFRGYVFRIMQNVWSPKYAILASALLFAIVHPSLSFPPVFALGLACAWLYSRTQKVWPGMLLHAAYNGAIVLMSG